jgi:hypothetical protein
MLRESEPMRFLGVELGSRPGKGNMDIGFHKPEEASAVRGEGLGSKWGR